MVTVADRPKPKPRPRPKPPRYQVPRIVSLPKAHSTKMGEEAVDFARHYGLKLDAWEAYVLENACAVNKRGKWAAFEVGVVVPRQNGKGSILEARELASLFLFQDRLTVHSAHMVDTSLEHFRRLLFLIEETDLHKQVKRILRGNGKEEIETRAGNCRIRFRTRSKGGGRGFTGDLLVLDEAMFLPTFAHGALLPTLSARPNPQVWYTGSAVDQLIHDDGMVLSGVRARGHAKARRLAYFEWSLSEETPDLVEDAVAEDPESWKVANPAMGIRIAKDHIAAEHASMDQRTFAVERLGVGDWPEVTRDNAVIDLQKWSELVDLNSAPLDPVCFSLDVDPTRSFATIGVAGWRVDGSSHVEVIERTRGTEWVLERLKQLNDRHNSVGFVCDARSPAASLIPALEDAGLEIVPTDAGELADGCGMIFDAVEQGTLRHLGQAEVRSAIKGAAKRPLGDAWAWSRKNSAVDITPLVALTLAHWGLLTRQSAEVFTLSW